MKRFFLILSLLLLLFTVTVSSHPGRTDSNGGHWNRKEGTYHYHSGEHAGENSSGSQPETTETTEPQETIEAPKQEKAPSEFSASDNNQTKPLEEEKPKGIDSKTIIIIVAIIVGGVVLFLISRQVIKHYSADEFFDKLFIIVLIIAGVILLRGCNRSSDCHIENCDGSCNHVQKFVDKEIKTLEGHSSYCDGSCDHVEDEISDRIYNGELIWPDDALDEEDLNDSYWDGVYDGYIQGYGDCYYGNNQELELDEYVDEELF